jgi:hypothetical protein
MITTFDLKSKTPADYFISIRELVLNKVRRFSESANKKNLVDMRAR